MPKSRFELAVDDVSKVFKTPRELLETQDISVEEKIQLLKNWENDLRGVLVASEEGMNRDRPGNAGEILRKVHAVLRELDAQSKKAPTPDKAEN